MEFQYSIVNKCTHLTYSTKLFYRRKFFNNLRYKTNFPLYFGFFKIIFISIVKTGVTFLFHLFLQVIYQYNYILPLDFH